MQLYTKRQLKHKFLVKMSKNTRTFVSSSRVDESGSSATILTTRTVPVENIKLALRITNPTQSIQLVLNVD